MIWWWQTTAASWVMASHTDPSDAHDDAWEDQLLVSEPKSPSTATPEDVPVINVRRVNPHGTEATEARRRVEEARARVARESSRGRRLGNPILLTLGLIAAIATAWLSFADPSVREPTPSALIGEWTPLHPAYAGARLVFSASTITIKSPSGTATARAITSLRALAEQAGVRVELTYPTPDGPVSLNATLQDNAAPPRLVFENPAGLVWERVAAAPTP
jgi:hypothetical protein